MKWIDMMNRVLSLLFLSITIFYGNDKNFEKIFKDFNLNGTLVVTSLNSDELYVYNAKRAAKRFTTASTFKIAHTLIALNEKVIKSENEIINWDGVRREYSLWNKDQTLQSAIETSCVWCFKRFSKKISKEKYMYYLSKFNYGNSFIGEDKSSFWLNGDLKISAYEQIDFLKKLYSNNLPIPKKYVDIVKKLIVVDKNKGYELLAKSGWDGTVGWYIGYVKSRGKVYFFAFNGEVKKEELAFRKIVVYKALESKNILF